MSKRGWALFLKELRQIMRDKKLIISLIIPPTVQLLIYGYALNPDVTNLQLGVVDESRTEISRHLVSSFVESHSFQVNSYFESPAALGRAIGAGKLNAGLVIPSDFARKWERREIADVQVLFDAVDSNTAGIARGYATRIISAFNKRLAEEAGSNGIRAAVEAKPGGPVASRVALLFNSGLESSWFIITGTLGILLVLNGSLVASASMVKEKEAGTVEQLLITPARAGEIITAKMSPLFLLIMADIPIALAVGYLVFGLPMRGSLVVLHFAGALCVLAGVGLGTFIATFTKSQQQAQLLSFFVNPPLALLSGATTPLEAMPEWLQPLTNVNPVCHFAIIARGVLLKGAGIEVLYPNLLALLGFALLLVGVSAWRFRKQLG